MAVVFNAQVNARRSKDLRSEQSKCLSCMKDAFRLLYLHRSLNDPKRTTVVAQQLRMTCERHLFRDVMPPAARPGLRKPSYSCEARQVGLRVFYHVRDSKDHLGRQRASKFLLKTLLKSTRLGIPRTTSTGYEQSCCCQKTIKCDKGAAVHGAKSNVRGTIAANVFRFERRGAVSG